jgi:eukaryotic-like serine/threonine-protein kinase
MPLEPDPDPVSHARDGPTRSGPAPQEFVESTQGPTGIRPGPEAGHASTLDYHAHANVSTNPDGGLRSPHSEMGTATFSQTPPGPTIQVRVDGGARTVGPFLLIERLGGGSQGEVWRALQVEPIHRTVALKLLRPHLTLHLEAADRMRKEAERGGKLNHETILPVLDFGRDGDSVYIAMPLVNGFTLSQVIATRKAWLANNAPADLPRLAILSEPAYWKAMAQLIERVTRALAHAHDERIVHRDVKPSNILLDRANDQRVFLADFGLARDLDDITTDAYSEPGTLLYMAPERLRGQGKYDENRADVFSMGATLFEAVTLQRAYNVPSDLPRPSWPSYLVGHPSPSPRKLSPHLPRDLAAIIEMAMDPSPSRRYESATALADDLANFSKGEPVKARPPGPIRRAWRWLLGQKALMLALGLATALLVAVGLFLLGNQINRARARADYALAEQLAGRGQLVEAYTAFDRGLQRSPDEPEATRIRVIMAKALRIKVLELAEDDEVEPIEEILGLYRKVTGVASRFSDPLIGRLGLRSLELAADTPDATLRVYPIRPDGRPRLNRLLYQGTVVEPGSKFILSDLIPGRYWVTATAPDGVAFDERPINIPPMGTTIRGRSMQVTLSPRRNAQARMVRIAGGEFWMGRNLVSSPDGGPLKVGPEMPAAEAVVPAFDLDATEVTNAQFAEFLKAADHQVWASEIWKNGGVYKNGEADWPVTNVVYEQALAYAAWRGCRLPTEHELEFVARGGQGRTVPPGLDEDPFKPGSSWHKLHQVGREPRDSIGEGSATIYDLFGNAGELTLFRYRPYPSMMVVRIREDTWNGFAVRSGLISVSSAAPSLLGYLGRASQLPSQQSLHIGFRCARSVRPWTETGPPHFKIQE